MIYLSALMSVPKELYEAADVDGITGFRKHWAITIPHLMPMIALVSTISSISCLSNFYDEETLELGSDNTISVQHGAKLTISDPVAKLMTCEVAKGA